MAYDLEEVDIVELSLVDVPANQHASVVLFKRFGYNDGVKPQNPGQAAKGEGQVTVEELTKKLEALQAQVTDLTKRAEDAEAAQAAAEAVVESLTKSADEAGLDVEDGKIVKRADPEYVEIDGEKVEKAQVPAPVLRAIEKANADIAKMKQEREEAELAKRGDTELPNLAGTGLAKGKLLKAVGEDADLLKSLKAADAAMAKNFEETGHGNAHDEASPGYRLEQMAKSHAETKGVSFETAYAEVTKTGTGAELLAAMRSEAN